jgi:serine phosphatase RsbU (regulator of sigma subunit)
MDSPRDTVKRPDHLRVIDCGQQRVIPLATLPFTIGRLENRSLSVADPRVSREHATIVQEGEDYFILDQASRHGTFVNGKRVNRSQLRPGDRVQLGDSDVVLVFEGDESLDSTTALLSQLSSKPATSDLEKLSLFVQAARTLNNSRVVDEVLTTMVDYALKLTGTQRGYVFLVDEHEQLTLAVGRNSRGMSLEDNSTISHSILRDAAATSSEFIIDDTRDLYNDDQRHSIIANALRTIIAIPLRSSLLESNQTARLLGVLYLDSHLASYNVSKIDHDLLRAIAMDAAGLVENAQLVRAEQLARTLRQEMEIAAKIQHSVISCDLPQLGFAKIGARTVPCKEVGGDFYDVIPLKDGLAAIVADVSGKGVSAALLASVIQGMMYAEVSAGVPLSDAVEVVNSFLWSRVAGQKYATMAAVCMSTDGELEIVNCGHVPPLILKRDGSIQEITEGTLPVGLMPGLKIHSMRYRLEPGDRIAIITDGVTEAEDGTGQEIDPAVLREALRAEDPISEAYLTLDRYCRGVPAHDDRTMIVIERLQPAGASLDDEGEGKAEAA